MSSYEVHQDWVYELEKWLAALEVAIERGHEVAEATIRQKLADMSIFDPEGKQDAPIVFINPLGIDDCELPIIYVEQCDMDNLNQMITEVVYAD